MIYTISLLEKQKHFEMKVVRVERVKNESENLKEM